jgi:hypothetical protein
MDAVGATPANKQAMSTTIEAIADFTHARTMEIRV